MKYLPTKIWLPAILISLAAFGFLVYSSWTQTIETFESSKLQLALNETPIFQIPSDWKTYRNEEYGFEIKYPNDWEIEISQKDQTPPFLLVLDFKSPVLVSPPPIGMSTNALIPASFDIYVFNLMDYLLYYEEKDLSFEEWLRERIKQGRLSDQEEIVIGKEKWFKFSEAAYGPLDSIHHYKDGLVYKIEINPDFPIKDVIYKILSTFQFLE